MFEGYVCVVFDIVLFWRCNPQLETQRPGIFLNSTHQTTEEKPSVKHSLVVLLLHLSPHLAREHFESGKRRSEISSGLCYGGKE